MPLLEKTLAGEDQELADRVRAALNMPQALARRPAETRASAPVEARELAWKSLEQGYLKDALKYLLIAHEQDPLDFEVMLKLGWTYNNLKDDSEAVRWFDLARRSPDAKIAAEASHAYKNLEPEFQRFRTTFWVFPTFSTRWHDLFAYSQIKTELRLPHWFVHPYVSARFIGDSEGAVNVANLGPQYLSERSVILASAWRLKRGTELQAGSKPANRCATRRASRIQVESCPIIAGVSHTPKASATCWRAASTGLFAETNDDGIFVSRFGNDTLLYSQNRTGYTFRSTESFLGFHAQFFWNWNATVDALGQYWANYVETGPGVRFRFEGMPGRSCFR